MADGITLDAGSGGATVATDDDGTFQHPVSKISLGENGQFDGYVSHNNPLPVQFSDGSVIRNVVYGEDSTHTDRDYGIQILGVRNDTLASLVSADGEYSPFQVNALGAVYVDGSGVTQPVSAASLPLPSGASTAANQSTANGHLASLAGSVYAEDSPATNADPGLQILAVRSDTASTKTGADGDYHPLLVDADGKLHVNPGTVTIQDGGGSITVDGTVSVSGVATAAKQPALGTAGTASADVITVQGIASMTPMLVDATGQGDVPVTLDGEAVVLGAGSAAIGKLAANSGVDIGDVDVTSQPARDRLTDNVGVALQTDALLNDTTALTPKFAVINATTNGDNTIVAAVAGKKIRVVAYTLVADAAVGVAFEDGAGGSEISGQMAFGANGGVSVDFCPLGHFETSENTLLNIELDAAANVRGHLTYVEV